MPGVWVGVEPGAEGCGVRIASGASFNLHNVHYAQLMLPAIVLAVIAFVGFRGNRRNARMLPL